MSHTPSALAATRGVRPGFNASLNGLRGLCALMVFVFHLAGAGVLEWQGQDVVGGAATFLGTSLAYGVELFFMISGFVIVGSLARHLTVSGFLKDRAIRIFSAWVPAITVTAVAGVVLGIGALAAAAPLDAIAIFIANLLLLPPLLPVPLLHFGSWSLTYEWVFYFAAAAGALLLTQPRRPWAVGVWACSVGLFVMLYPPALFFLTGVIVYRRQEWLSRHRVWLRWPAISLVLFLLAWRFTEPTAAQPGSTFVHWALDGRWLAAVCAFIASLHVFASITLEANRSFAFLKTRAFQFLGAISYSLYLWHAIVMAGVKRIVNAHVTPVLGSQLGFVCFALVTAVASIAVSWASWRLFETALAQRCRRAIAPAVPWRSAHAA